jgi:hypothetical protein
MNPDMKNTPKPASIIFIQGINNTNKCFSE